MSLNKYGDELNPTTGQHGADIASQRIDDLDKQALQHLLGLTIPQAVCVDLGCGFGWQGIRFAMLGGHAYLYDQLPEGDFVRLCRHSSALPINYISCDLRTLRAPDFPAEVHLAFSQRFVHYLRYAEAHALVASLANRQPAGTLFFLSASGIDSELGLNYPRSKLPDRFAPLIPAMQNKHGIFEPVCYTTKQTSTN
jgi:hypothetical protein